MAPERAEPSLPRLFAYDDGRRRWLTTWYDDFGVRRSKHFGFEGEVSEARVTRLYNAFVAKWRVTFTVRNPGKREGGPLTVTGLCARYLRFAGRTFVKAGERTTHVSNIKYALRALRDACGEDLADELDAPKLARLRDAMVNTSSRAGGVLALRTVNDRLHSIQAAYQWSREQGLVSKETAADVASVSRLRKGRTTAKAPGKVKSVDESVIREVMKHMPGPVAALVELMLLTGMRPGEACRVRGCDIEAGGDVWLYRPERHKFQHLDKERVVPFGPRAQEVIRPWLKRSTTAYLFSPKEAHAERLEEKRKGRKTPLWPSHAKRRQADPVAKLGDHYDAGSLRKAIRSACRLADVAPFHPNQIRHTTATALRKTFGIETASVQLGHSNLNTTEIYAEKSLQQAMRIAREVG